MNENVEQWRLRKPAVTSPDGVVAAQHWQAARAGAAMLAEGGNAVDAAVACAMALNVVEPWMCGLGGSGFMVVWLAEAQEARVLNFQGTLAGAIDTADYPLDPAEPDSLMGYPGVKDQANVRGYGAITVPGAVAGLSAALTEHGRLSWAEVLAPTIALAERGLAVDWHTTLQIALSTALLRRDPTAGAHYLPDGVPLQPETHRPLPALTETLKTLAAEGPESFYRGALAEKIAADLQAGGSRISFEDLGSYEVERHAPLSGNHRGAAIHTAGETSGGQRLLDMLAHAEAHFDPGAEVGPDTWIAYARALDEAFATHKRKVGLAAEGGCTSHMSAVDRDGNMVALTYTLLNRFGSGVMLPQTGILMNNSVSYFDPRPGNPVSMAGGKRINSSNMCPTIATRDGQALFAVGASGANHIVPCTSQITALLLDYGMSLEEAFHTPRIDASARGSVRADPAMGEAALAALADVFELEVAQLLVFPKLYSCPSGVLRDPADGTCWGAADISAPSAGAAAAAPWSLATKAAEETDVRA
ncbi:gamma-glutamyltransferase family protein [Pelagibius sp.]|uniref:gamma-glutamyltransferase family protein n=1 Tax=Pelagibius sp. TaxID=1931238 RepID=UPI002610E9DC|nr:gamma-glutamyltransferase [Pelagibius sp.]